MDRHNTYFTEIYVAEDHLIGWMKLKKGRHTVTFVCEGKGRSNAAGGSSHLVEGKVERSCGSSHLVERKVERSWRLFPPGGKEGRTELAALPTWWKGRSNGAGGSSHLVERMLERVRRLFPPGGKEARTQPTALLTNPGMLEAAAVEGLGPQDAERALLQARRHPTNTRRRRPRPTHAASATKACFRGVRLIEGFPQAVRFIDVWMAMCPPGLRRPALRGRIQIGGACFASRPYLGPGVPHQRPTIRFRGPHRI
jgi:hypothetical protein